MPVCPGSPLSPLQTHLVRPGPQPLHAWGRGLQGDQDTTNLQIPPPPDTLCSLHYPLHQINPLTAISTIRPYSQFAENKTKISLKANLYLKRPEGGISKYA